MPTTHHLETQHTSCEQIGLPVVIWSRAVWTNLLDSVVVQLHNLQLGVELQYFATSTNAIYDPPNNYLCYFTYKSQEQWCCSAVDW